MYINELDKDELGIIKFALTIDLETVLDNPKDWSDTEARKIKRLLAKVIKALETGN